MNENLKRTLNNLRNKQKRKVWLRAFRMWQCRPHEVRPLSDATHECASCGDTYTGNFCPRCGQSARIGRFSFKTAFLLFLDTWGMGNRSMFRSIRDLILRPGYMIRDYLRGMQSAYFPPFKMFFVFAAISFLAEKGFGMIYGETENEQESIEVTEESSKPQETSEVSTKQLKAEAPIQSQDGKSSSDADDGKTKAKIEKVMEQTETFVFKPIGKFGDDNPNIIVLLLLIFVFLPLYFLLRSSPAIPDLRYSEFLIAVVYSANAATIVSICGTILNSDIINLMSIPMFFLAMKQFSGYSFFQMLFRLLLALLITAVAAVAIVTLLLFGFAVFSGYIG